MIALTKREAAPRSEGLAHAAGLAAPVLRAVEERIDAVVSGLEGRVRPVVAHLVDAGGKRVRPLLVALSGAAFGAPVETLAELGAAVELIHTATLLHDDVIDRGAVRRGAPTANARFGDGPPVLSGDYLYARVFKRLLARGYHDALDTLASTVEALVAGELLQLARRDDPAIMLSEAVAIAERKTASLFAFAVSEGARAGAASDAVRARMALFGRRLGLAFQVLDDVLDLEDGTGKVPLKDLAEGTFTLPVLLARERDPSMDRLLARLAATAREERAPRTAELALRVRRAGGAERARMFARSLALRARRALVGCAPPGPARDALVSLNDELVARTR